MRQIAEKMAAVRVIAQILNDRPAVSICMRVVQLVPRGIRVAK